MDANWRAYNEQIKAIADEQEDMLTAHEMLNATYNLYVAQGRKLEWENFEGWMYFNQSDIYVLILSGYFDDLASKDPKDYILVNVETGQEHRYSEWFEKVSSLLPATWHRVYASDELGTEIFDKDSAHKFKESLDNKKIKSVVRREEHGGWSVDIFTNNLTYFMHSLQ